jgi:hypothetical protein
VEVAFDAPSALAASVLPALSLDLQIMSASAIVNDASRQPPTLKTSAGTHP